MSRSSEAMGLYTRGSELNQTPQNRVMKMLAKAQTYSSLEQVIVGSVISPEMGTEYTVAVHFKSSREAVDFQMAIDDVLQKSG